VRLKGQNYQYEFDINDPIRQRGKNGVVWKGFCLENQNNVIIKWHKTTPHFKPTHIHDSIQYLIEEITIDSKVFRIYNYIEGVDLQSIFEDLDKKWKNTQFIVDKWIQTLEVLDTLHQNKLLHTDIKLSNILYDVVTDSIKLIDLDSAQHYPLEKPPQRAYIFSSPEQYLGYKELMGPWSDIFSTGICFYSLIKRELPYPLTHPALIEQKQLAFALEYIDEIHEDLNQIFQKCCLKPSFPIPPLQNTHEGNIKPIIENITKRYTTCQDLISDLRKLDLRETKKWYQIW